MNGELMRKPTGQMQEETQELLDDYNTLYCWEYNDMCEFIENHSCLLYTSDAADE